MESSLQPLTKLGAPLLFVQPGQDPLCSGLLIRENVDRMPASDIRMIELPVGVGRETTSSGCGEGGAGHRCNLPGGPLVAVALHGWMQGWVF